ncbi:hypothetical protein HAX54_052403, partial [Datura stramonium]|nr:hypothetical protein [Datura stramonium]
LIGYLPDFKFRKKHSYNANNAAMEEKKPTFARENTHRPYNEESSKVNETSHAFMTQTPQFTPASCFTPDQFD